ncbi:putative metal-nicotianamine transporter YSL5 [Sesamum angolense]|uniref:Metal-nicotianamine transporter YSL5 n=1 Tax=Sesamum angolense TaxID=2727404 RepID=A0AAE1WKC1_9LAMI|nr:putative metal-nicotianamine transporter YSL5 [Sesamum angolense]
MGSEGEKNVEGGIELQGMDDEKKEKVMKEDEVFSVERIFENKEVPSWRKQLTVRAFAVSFLLSVMFCFIVMKLNLTTGIVPSLNVSAGLLGFFFVKTWTKLIAKSGMLRQPFTRQENTSFRHVLLLPQALPSVKKIAKYTEVAPGFDQSFPSCAGGFGSYLFGMSKQIAQQSEHRTDGFDYKNPSLGWMIGFLSFCFLGLFLRGASPKIMIIDFKLTYPSGTATAHLINSFHTPEGAKLARREVERGASFSPSQNIACGLVVAVFFTALVTGLRCVGLGIENFPKTFVWCLARHYPLKTNCPLTSLGQDFMRGLATFDLGIPSFNVSAIVINMIRDSLGKKRSWFIPLPMAMAIPFYLGSYFAIDMCVWGGSDVPVYLGRK